MKYHKTLAVLAVLVLLCPALLLIGFELGLRATVAVLNGVDALRGKRRSAP